MSKVSVEQLKLAGSTNFPLLDRNPAFAHKHPGGRLIG